MKNTPTGKGLLIFCITIAILIAGYAVLTRPDDRNGVQKIGDALHELPNGADKAARELKDRTPGDRLVDAAKDEKEKATGTSGQ